MGHQLPLKKMYCNPPHSSKDSYIMESIVNEHNNGLDTCFLFCNLRCLTV